MTALVLHDLGTEPQQLAAMLPPLPDVWAPPLPGHAAPAETEQLSVFGMAQQVARQLPARAHESPLTVIGLGLGAAVGLRIVLSGVHRIDRFVAIRPSWGPQPLPEHLAVYPVLASLLAADPRTAVQRFESSGVFNDIKSASRATAAELLAIARDPETSRRIPALSEAPMHHAFEAHEFEGLDAASMVLADPDCPVHPIGLAHQWQSLLGAALRVTPARGRHPQAADGWIRQELASYLVGVR